MAEAAFSRISAVFEPDLHRRRGEHFLTNIFENWCRSTSSLFRLLGFVCCSSSSYSPMTDDESFTSM